MVNMRNLATKCIYCLAILAISPCAVTSDEVTTNESSDVEQAKLKTISKDSEENGGRILSRKKRFLQFPEGSSFQVVYDQTIPVVGSTLLFTVGITCALAWQLPSISIFEISKMLREQAMEGVHISRQDEDINNTTLIDTSSSKYETSNKHSYYYTNSSDKSYYTQPSGTKNLLSYYSDLQNQQQSRISYPSRINYYTNTNDDKFGTNNNYYANWQNPQQSKIPYGNTPQNFVSPYNWNRKDWSSLVNQYLQAWIRRHPPNYQLSKKRIYPVFGKRSIDEHTHPEDKFFLNHHRTTRHDLYLHIEKFLEAKGKHGHHCVLRALCESGQRRDNNEPESFLKEILKAVFSIPTIHETPDVLKHRIYDEAHAHTGNCAERYSNCKDSIWSEDFIF